MLDTTKLILTNNTRNFFKKIKEAPVLYFIFASMTFFSLIMFASATYFIMSFETGFNISLDDVFYTVFFIFLLKSGADLYNHFVKSEELSYPLSTQVHQSKTIFEVFISILVSQLVIWFSFSILFLLMLSIFNIQVLYLLEYAFFTVGIIAATALGCTASFFFFSKKKYRILPTFFLLAFCFYSQKILFVILISPLAFVHLYWAIKNSMDSFLFSNRKERIKEKAQIKQRGLIKTLFYRETTVLWRDKLLFSFIFFSVSSGLFTGYLYLYGHELLIPEQVRQMLGEFLPQMFVFLGIYVVVVYTAVFPGLNLFLNEEKTMWINRHLPIRNETIIYGKTSALALCFITSIPFVFYISIFIGVNNIVFLLWLLIISYLAGVIIAVPIGAKYVGKKSDILLLYSMAMILLAVIGVLSFLGSFVEQNIEHPIVIYSLIVSIEIILLFISLKISARIIRLDYS